jgi:tetratricopeptide (TPR) repeat protein
MNDHIALLLLATLCVPLACSREREGGHSIPASPVTADAGSADAGSTEAAAKPIPKADKELSAAERRQYNAALTEGRTLQRKKDFRGSIVAFRKALTIWPDDPHALSELGWAALFAKDLDLAESSLQRALDCASESELRGSVLYNLGRVHEERDHKQLAIDSYVQSLRVRPNATVLARLRTLDMKMAAQMEMFELRTALGPFSSIGPFCSMVNKSPTLEPGERRCAETSREDEEILEGAQSIAAPAMPWRAVRLVQSCSGPFCRDTRLHLAMKIDTSWYVMPDVGFVCHPGAGGITANLRTKSLKTVDVVVGDNPEVVLELHGHMYDSDMGLNEYSQEETDTLVVCGIGASGVPSCTGAIPYEMQTARRVINIGGDEPGYKHTHLFDISWSLTTAFEGSDLVIEAKSGKLDEAQKALIGRHPLIWK